MRAVMVIALLLGGCVVGAPPGFSPGEAWTFPLVDPLARTPLIVPVTVHGKGPFLFIVDPDAKTQIDVAFLREMSVVVWEAITDVQIGTLHVESLKYEPSKQHTFDVVNRRIAGVLGREVFTASLVFGFDRSTGLAWLATPKHAHVPDNARRFDLGAYRTLQASLDGESHDLHVDLGRTSNLLAGSLWDRLAVTGQSRRTVSADGVVHVTTMIATVKTVAIGTLERYGVTFAELNGYFWKERVGSLGLDFFSDFAVALSFDTNRLYLAPPASVDRSARLERWNLGCKRAGCVELRLHGRELEVIPERAGIQLRVRATATDNRALPDLEVDLDPGAQHFAVVLDERYSDATLEVLDASPFPRTCLAAKECVVPAP